MASTPHLELGRRQYTHPRLYHERQTYGTVHNTTALFDLWTEEKYNRSPSGYNINLEEDKDTQLGHCTSDDRSCDHSQIKDTRLQLATLQSPLPTSCGSQQKRGRGIVPPEFQRGRRACVQSDVIAATCTFCVETRAGVLTARTRL